MRKEIMDRVRRIEGFRDGFYHHASLERCAEYIKSEFKSYGFVIEEDEFTFNNKSYQNIISTSGGVKKQKEWILVGAHYDAVMGSPGADDNASGMAVMLEAARVLGPKEGLKFVAFTLEEPQPNTVNFLFGSKRFVKRMKSLGQRYRAVFILESVGYISRKPESQLLPPFVKAPKVGDFIGLVGNRRAEKIMSMFKKTAYRYVPELKVETYRALLRGIFLPETRFSDHAPFWDAGYPAVMITDTAMLRNPNYHTEFDTSETLSGEFMEQVTRALIKTVEALL